MQREIDVEIGGCFVPEIETPEARRAVRRQAIQPQYLVMVASRSDDVDAPAAIQIGDFSTAIGDLNALIHEVNAQTGKKISASAAAALIAAANAIIAVL